MKDRSHRFGAFHLVACCCVVAAFISAMVSSYPALAALKALSIFLLFLYGAAGARLAVGGREAQFLSGLLVGCEILVYINVAIHFILRVSLFNNPNSLGALTGVALTPLLAWGVATSNEIATRRRRSFAFILAILLLLFSFARAAIVGALLPLRLRSRATVTLSPMFLFTRESARLAFWARGKLRGSRPLP